MSVFYVDVETDGLYGKFLEGAVVKLEQEPKSAKTQKWFNQLFDSFNNNEDIVVFWHRYIPDWIKENDRELYNKFKGRFICFMDIYNATIQLQPSINTIADATKNILNREHKGEAKQDAIDLMQAYGMYVYGVELDIK